METLPDALRVVFSAWTAGFGETVFPKFVTLVLGAMLTTGRRTVSHVLHVVGELADADPSSYHRVLSMRRWSMWSLARPLVVCLLDTFLPRGVVFLVGDETVTEHPGRKVFGKGRHRDSKRSSHSFVAHLWGHKWVVLAILVKLPGIPRPWALPVLVALYRNEKDNQAAGRRHKTPSDLMRQLLCVLLRWFPARQFVFSGDGGYANHMLTRFARQHQKRLTLVSRFYADAEVTFQEVRAYLGVETTRGWIERTVLRAEPCLFGLYSVVVLWYAALPARDREHLEPTWTGKTMVTFSNAITLVRRDLWRRWIFATPAFKVLLQKLKAREKAQLIRHLTLAT
jgi:hypothetical protein